MNKFRGRMVYAIGNNPVGALFSGVRVARVKFILFPADRVMSGVGRGLPHLPAGFDASVHRPSAGNLKSSPWWSWAASAFWEARAP